MVTNTGTPKPMSIASSLSATTLRSENKSTNYWCRRCLKAYPNTCGLEQKYINLCLISINGIMTTKEDTKKHNRIKAVLAETGHTGKWLTEQLGNDPATASK